jgi:hypothetical protein
MDERSSSMRVAITIAIDWRFVTALVILVLARLMRQANSRKEPPLPESSGYSKTAV